MPLIRNRYGKGRVRVMRIHRDGDRQEVSQLNVKAMIEGDFARAYTHGDNSTSVSTDTIKNVVNIIARENTGALHRGILPGTGERNISTAIRRSPPSRSPCTRPNGAGSASAASRIRIASCSTATASPPWKCRRPRRRDHDVVGHRRLCLHEVDAVGLGELRQGQLHDDSADRRPDVRDQHGGVVEMVGQAGETIPRPTRRSSTPCWKCSR